MFAIAGSKALLGFRATSDIRLPSRERKNHLSVLGITNHPFGGLHLSLIDPFALWVDSTVGDLAEDTETTTVVAGNLTQSLYIL